MNQILAQIEVLKVRVEGMKIANYERQRINDLPLYHEIDFKGIELKMELLVKQFNKD